MVHKRFTREEIVEKIKAPLVAQRQRRREYFQRLTPRIKASATTSMVERELAILWSIGTSPGGFAPMWGTLTRLARTFARTGYVQAVHPERQKFLAVLQRLITAKMVLRFRCRRWNSRKNDLFLSELGLQRLYFLRGIQPPDRWATEARPQQGPSLEQFLESPQDFTFPDTWPALPASSGIDASTKVAALDPLPSPPPAPGDGWGGRGAARPCRLYVV